MSTFTILHLKGECITSDKMFQNYFDLQEAMTLLKVIVEAGQNLFTGDELRYIGCLKDSERGRLPKTIQTRDNNTIAILENDSELPLPYLTITSDCIENLALRDWQEILLNHLGHKSCTLNFVKPHQNPQLNETIEIMESENPLKLQILSLSPLLSNPIRTVKIINHTYDESNVTIQIVNDNGDTIDLMTIKYGECRFANFTGDQLIEFLPIMSLSRTQLGCIKFDDKEKINVRSITLRQQKESTFDINGISQFCVDEEGGIIAITNGRLEVRSTAFSIKDIKSVTEHEERIVKIVAMGNNLLALSSFGKVYSNIPKFRVLNKTNIISIGINWAGIPYYLSSDGTLTTGPKQWENVYRAISTNNDTFSIKLRDGKIQYSNEEFLPATPEESVRINGTEYKFNLTNRTLYLGNPTCELASNVDSLCLMKTGNGYDIVTCSDSVLSIIKSNSI